MMNTMMRRLWHEDAGQSIPEYALIIALVSIGLMLVLVAFRDEIGRVFNSVRGELETQGTPAQVPVI